MQNQRFAIPVEIPTDHRYKYFKKIPKLKQFKPHNVTFIHELINEMIGNLWFDYNKKKL